MMSEEEARVFEDMARRIIRASMDELHQNHEIERLKHPLPRVVPPPKYIQLAFQWGPILHILLNALSTVAILLIAARLWLR